ncbi:unnamed protein product [Anisakis simplex]|uniref:Uncharacterized protein n=1 Tax=Anisakis simplex TaxID=6269 RepID=A0A0M3JLQ1_ANISI|nr:unnamed protein product [Anisakis simplex]
MSEYRSTISARPGFNRTINSNAANSFSSMRKFLHFLSKIPKKILKSRASLNHY